MGSSSQTKEQREPPTSGPTLVSDPSGLNEAKAVDDIEGNTTTTADVEASLEDAKKENIEKGDSVDVDVKDKNDGDEEKEIIAKEDSGHGSDQSHKSLD